MSPTASFRDEESFEINPDFLTLNVDFKGHLAGKTAKAGAN